MAAAVDNRSNTACSRNSNGRRQQQQQHDQQRQEIVYQIVLEESSDVDTYGHDDESDESVFSIQAETTVSAKDSSDISTSCDVNEYWSDGGGDSGGAEFDVASSSSQSWPHPWSYDRNVSSESSPPLSASPDRSSKISEPWRQRQWQWQRAAADYETATSSCLASGDDNDVGSSRSCGDSDGNYDKEFKFPYCAMCCSLNRNPSFQFCDSCYRIKKGFFPEKPAAKKKRRRVLSTTDRNARPKKKIKQSRSSSGSPCLRHSSVNRVGVEVASTVATAAAASSGSPNNDAVSGSNLSLSSFRSIRCSDGEPSNADSSIAVVPQTAGASANANASTSTSVSVSTNTSASFVDSAYQSRTTNNDGGGEGDGYCSVSKERNTEGDEDDKCLACLLKPTNALFLHGKTGHRCCCYRCAKRIWFQTRRCPICRSRVANIIRILNV